MLAFKTNARTTAMVQASVQILEVRDYGCAPDDSLPTINREAQILRGCKHQLPAHG